MKKFPFAKNKKQSPCLIRSKDFKKYRKLLLTGVVVMQLDKLIVASAKAYAIIKKANHDCKSNKETGNFPGLFFIKCSAANHQIRSAYF